MSEINVNEVYDDVAIAEEEKAKRRMLSRRI